MEARRFSSVRVDGVEKMLETSADGTEVFLDGRWIRVATHPVEVTEILTASLPVLPSYTPITEPAPESIRDFIRRRQQR